MNESIYIKNFNNTNIDQIKFSLEEYAFLFFIINHGNQANFDEIAEYFRISSKDIILLFKKISQYSKIKMEVEHSENENLWILEFIKSEKEIKVPEKIEQIFKIDSQNLNFQNQQLVKKQIINFVNSNMEKFIQQKEVIINNKEEYFRYIKETNPLTLLLNLNIIINNEITDFLYEKLINEKLETDYLNFAFEYCITSSIYNNLSLKYVQIILDSWKKNKLVTFKECFDFIETTKTQKVKGLYEAPEWDEAKNEVSKIEKIDIDKILEEEGIL